jgi:hypothetical protein
MGDDCDRCGLPIPAADLFTVVHRVNGKTIARTEHFHRDKCCPYAFWGPKPEGVLNDIWIKAPE